MLVTREEKASKRMESNCVIQGKYFFKHGWRAVFTKHERLISVKEGIVCF